MAVSGYGLEDLHTNLSYSVLVHAMPMLTYKVQRPSNAHAGCIEEKKLSHNEGPVVLKPLHELMTFTM